ncbi:metal-dependent hydrolase [Geobacter argillaceus]|uniref:L-ascorbate metabolism protein UlaG (Beta-lactamase superfamily) n=1 Tax=Geobacter argillaceus TaxID=345631 RepID=A0A562V8G6_9BACT|nr:metal-dependent hydrolase [Geobacter argillaceus]TWJ14171.1 L-ascorbate metabolism protein UlaG (beta-lactamase superfamily) [Geobacter argillaceus]
MEIRLLGHSMLRIKTEKGKVIVVDPWIAGNPTCPKEWQTPQKWEDVDLVLCSHAHFDHSLGFKELLKANRRVMGVVQYEHFLKEFAGRASNVFPLNFGGTYSLLNGIRVTLVAANHSSSFGEERSFESAGVPAGFVIRLENGYTIYVSGDTSYTSEMETLIKPLYKPDLAVLSTGDIFTMGPAEGAFAAKALGVKHAIPYHWFPNPEDAADPEGMRGLIQRFPPLNFMLERHRDFALELAHYSGIEAVILRAGESFTPPARAAVESPLSP